MHEKLVLTISVCKVWSRGAGGCSGPFYVRYWPFKHEGLRVRLLCVSAVVFGVVCGFDGGYLASALVDATPESLRIGETDVYC